MAFTFTSSAFVSPNMGITPVREPHPEHNPSLAASTTKPIANAVNTNNAAESRRTVQTQYGPVVYGTRWGGRMILKGGPAQAPYRRAKRSGVVRTPDYRDAGHSVSVRVNHLDSRTDPVNPLASVRAACSDPLFQGVTRIVRKMAGKAIRNPNDSGTVVGTIRTRHGGKVDVRWFNRTDIDDVVSAAYGNVVRWMRTGYVKGPNKGTTLSEQHPYFWAIVRRACLDAVRQYPTISGKTPDVGIAAPNNPQTNMQDVRDLFTAARKGLERDLTDAEQTVLMGLGLGRTQTELATELGVNQATISRTIERLREGLIGEKTPR
jgi:DNA-directed RNA polymerase specialized sigma24 family protein